MTGTGHNSPQALLADIEAPDARASYVLGRLEHCRGISRGAMTRAFTLAGRALGLPLEEARYWLQIAQVAGPSALIPRVRAINARDAGYVYIAQDVTRSDIVKIGFTRDPEARRKRLNALCRADIRILSATPGIMLDEHAQHCRFHSARMFGEWFQASAVLH